MLKNILKLEGVHPLTKNDQKSIHGASRCASDECTNAPDGTVCNNGKGCCKATCCRPNNGVDCITIGW